mmetsp:Transcript_5692/g.11406  ORF Transcript_5692/g.11406 Transcript_5692/m.11406 type:complete len:218 (-) Transcript_5692:590-1243(-)
MDGSLGSLSNGGRYPVEQRSSNLNICCLVASTPACCENSLECPLSVSSLGSSISNPPLVRSPCSGPPWDIGSNATAPFTGAGRFIKVKDFGLHSHPITLTPVLLYELLALQHMLGSKSGLSLFLSFMALADHTLLPFLTTSTLMKPGIIIVPFGRSVEAAERRDDFDKKFNTCFLVITISSSKQTKRSCTIRPFCIAYLCSLASAWGSLTTPPFLLL